MPFSIRTLTTTTTTTTEAKPQRGDGLSPWLEGQAHTRCRFDSGEGHKILCSGRRYDLPNPPRLADWATVYGRR